MIKTGELPPITDVVLAVPSVELAQAADRYLFSIQQLSRLRSVKTYERLTGNAYYSTYIEPETREAEISELGIPTNIVKELAGILALTMSVRVIPGTLRAIRSKSQMVQLAELENVPPITQPAIVAEKIVDTALMQEEYGPWSRTKLDLKSR